MTIAIERMHPKQLDDHWVASPDETATKITAYTARQKVSGYVGRSISHMMGGDEPALIFNNQRLVWRVPIVLTSPTRGVLGQVGVLDVDARTGQIYFPPSFLTEIQSNAQALVGSGSPQTTERI